MSEDIAPIYLCSCLNVEFRKICIFSVLVLVCRYLCLNLTTLDNGIRNSGHYSKVNKPNQCYPLIFVGTVIATGSMSNLVCSFFSQIWAHFFTSYQLLVKDKHRVLVKGLE